jgi:NADH-quinone oxidoreductase subunit L
MLINRVGDFFFLVGISIIFFIFKSVDFFIIFSQVHIYQFKYVFKIFNLYISIIDVISLFLLIGAITKSAQLGFHG